MNVELKNIVKTYGKFAAVRDVSLRLASGELTAIIGPSGCGKTTLLRIIAGLLEHDSGRIELSGEDIGHLPPQERNAVLVFQGYALFPHLTVLENVAFGLRARNVKKVRREQLALEALAAMRLEDQAFKAVQQLSGGQQQRVALARALVVRPSLLLFDEPLSNLDEKLRVSMRSEIRDIQQQHGITSLYVTHDQVEALSIADKVAVMFDGQIHQFGSPREIYDSPTTPQVASFVGQANIVELQVVSENSSSAKLQWGTEIIETKLHKALSTDKALCMIRPEELHFAASGVPVSILTRDILGPLCRYTCETDNASGAITIDTLNRVGDISLASGERTHLSLSGGHLYVFPV